MIHAPVVAVALFAAVRTAVASKPRLSVNLRDGSFSDLGRGLTPTIKWNDSCEAGDFGLQYGVDIDARIKNSLASLPQSVWGRVTRKLGDWGVSAKATIEGDVIESPEADLLLSVDNKKREFLLKMSAAAGKGEFSLGKIEASKEFDIANCAAGTILSYNVETGGAESVIGLDMDKTYLEVTAYGGAEKAMATSIKISQQLNENNRIIPKVTSDRKLSVEWERLLGGGNSVMTTFKPRESVNVKWKDGPWTANIFSPMDGLRIEGTDVSIKRDISF